MREGLDIPEVSLVAILDADKEGFLRSTSSLIQTIGRAARNVNGRAILYADKITGSIERAMDETQRRREKQEAYNLEHGLVPKGITKGIQDILELPIPGAQGSTSGRKRGGKTAPPEAEVPASLSVKDATKAIKQMEDRMYAAARDLEFEEAARLRDQIRVLQEKVFTNPM